MKKNGKTTNKIATFLIIIMFALTCCIQIGSKPALNSDNTEKKEEQIIQEKIAIFEKSKGQYNPSRIILKQAPPVETSALSEALGAEIKTSKDGLFFRFVPS